MTKKGNGLEDMSDEIDDRCNKFAFLMFKKLKEETGSWLEGNSGAQHHAGIKDIHDRARKLKDKIRRAHHLSDKRADKYEKQVPTIRVSVTHNFIRIASDDWFDVTVGKVGPGTIDVDHLYDKIKECFGVFAIMVRCKLRREINNTLLGIEKAFFRDMWLTAVKTNFEQRITVPTLELKKWVERVSTKTDSNGRPNPDYIPGMDVLAGWDLTMAGPFAQTYRLVFWCSSAAACRMSPAGTALGLPDFGLSRSPLGPSLLNRSAHLRMHRAVTSKTAAMFSVECPSSSTARTAISLVLTFRSFSVRIAELSSSRRFMIRMEDVGSISFVTVGSFCGTYFCASL